MRPALLAQLLCSAIETIANQAFALSEKPVTFAEKYQGKALAIDLKELGFSLQFQYISAKLLVTSPEQPAADCTITTSLSTLNKIKSEYQLTELIKADQLDISGDMKLAQQFAALAESIEIDWGSAIEAHIGDVATHKLLSLVAKAKDKLNFAKAQISADMSEYLVFEQQLVVSAGELRHFNEGVKNNQQHAEQLAQRIDELSAKITKLNHH
ncbi:ubiquinone biosynthesis accessory factor UbiJ [Thalassotalea montiporae]